MLKAGYYVCPHCGKVSQKIYYKQGDEPRGVYLIPPKGLTKKNDWIVDPEGDWGGTVTLEKDVRVDRAMLDDMIYVKVDGVEVKRPLYRMCPECKEYRLDNGYGRRPTFVLCMAGACNSGKTSILESWSHASNLKELTGSSFPFSLSCTDIHMESEAKEQATGVNSRGATTYYNIVDKKTNQVVAGLLLLDMAGELYKNDSQNDSSMRWLKRVWSGDEEGYDGADGLFVLDASAADGEQTAENNSGQKPGDAASTLNVLTKYGLNWEKISCAYIYTKLDKILEREDAIPHMESTDGVNRPLLTAETFPEGATRYTRDATLARCALEHHIASRITTGLMEFYRGAKNLHGFLIQSCVNGTDGPDYRRTTNLYDPLIWMMNAVLQCFPLE